MEGNGTEEGEEMGRREGSEGKGEGRAGRGKGSEISPPRSFLKVGVYDTRDSGTAVLSLCEFVGFRRKRRRWRELL